MAEISYSFLYFPHWRNWSRGPPYLALVAPRADVLARGGAYFVCWELNECLGVEWEVCLCMGLGFPWGGVRVLAGGIGQGVLLVLTVADPGANAIGGVEAWVLSKCQVWAELE